MVFNFDVPLSQNQQQQYRLCSCALRFCPTSRFFRSLIMFGGAGGIRTHGPVLRRVSGLANRRDKPLYHGSMCLVPSVGFGPTINSF